jgi:Rps23 Pro-64 3,4-dihydroxylase Tpa1-like proline 4-hydroxylase
MLNPALDAAALAAGFARHGRLQVRDVLLPQAAAAAHRCLAAEVPWSFTYRLDGRNELRSPEELQAMGAQERAAIGRRILEQARNEFSFGFMTYPLLREQRAGRGAGLFAHRVLEALASPEFIGFVRAVTGDARIERVDAQATRYTAGHFLSLHDDADHEGEARRCAYVLNLSDGWRAEWGGLLQFVAPDGSVAESFVPHFNSLSLFAVPTRHLVSYVAPYATAPRLAITGWFTAA